MRKSLGQCLQKSSFLSQRQTNPDLTQEKKLGVRFATQYQLTIPDIVTNDPNQLELVRIKEKYKWKCEELDRTKQVMEEEHKSIEERANKLSKGEKEIRILASQIKDKLNVLGEQEQNFREKVQLQEEKMKEREQQLQISMKQLEDQQNTLELEKNKLKIREKCLQEKEFIIDQNLREAEQYVDKLKYQLQNVNQKENYYHQQIDKLNSGLQTIIQHELSIKNIEFNLSKQVQQLREVEQSLIEQIQNCRQQEEVFDQRDLNIQVSEQLINRKLEWDNKQIQSAKISKLNTENSRMEISNFVHSAFSQKF
ncbi:unnamed protein product (macronuclear) [Paramecium tetraurelia]|uniref:Uncharacterized protein n=1 Tax=Paramecium tetraurelia TaxID=5888 RepID=A0CFW7_PARTE|nr:uncharacterized protein GSPATT00038126001 [Paramecium tetraurelia]CAK69684.1 unnamed protein product [Paramecium tetraurelia]|eukprot:XP_001437081.1 hypothetical protein (macronuclear) [Paramecium tetraurelia strain d4-2]